MKTNPRAIRSMTVLMLLLLSAAPVQAQETMLGVHGGSNQSGTPGRISTVNQNNANTIIIGAPAAGVGLTGVATDSTGRVFATTGYNQSNPENGPRLLEINPATGALISDIGRLSTAGGLNCYVGDLSFQPGTDVLYGVLANQGDDDCGWEEESSPGGALLTIDTSTAEVTLIGRDPSLGNANGGLAFHPDGTLYFTPCWSSDTLLVTLDPDTAAVLTSKTLANKSCYMGLVARPSDGQLFGSYNWESNWDPYVLVTLNPANGVATLVGHTYSAGIIHDLTFTDAIEVPFEINAGMADAWFEPATGGQGFFITVYEESETMFLAWFTYDTERPPGSAMANLGEPGHRWITAQGPYDGDTAELTVNLSEGGVFDSASPAVGDPTPIGSMTIVWHDCDSATLSYDLDPPGVSGEIELQRIASDNAAYCEAYQP
ncbi:MAG: hypothetical protein PVI22_12990 [Lysobacterales bacterium]|jgi:hypothetical protein